MPTRRATTRPRSGRAVGSPITAIRATVNSNQVNLQDINQQHSDLQLYWKGVTESISHTDLLDASTKISSDQALLTASFQAFARITSLHLSDYLH